MTEKEKKQVKKALERLGYSQKEIHVIFDEYKQCCDCEEDEEENNGE